MTKINISGEANPQSKLSEVDVKAIRLLHSEGLYGPTKIAALYGVSKATIDKIVAGKLWKSI